jgi:glycosyltransferase involved in cell wall biosynthesis
MRILILHNTYQRPGGEDTVVAKEVKILSAGGHAVELATVSNDEIVGLPAKLRTLLHTPYDGLRGEWVESLIARTGAEIVHVHNFFPLLTPAVHQAAARSGVAVVQTLHNFRLICAGAMLLRDGRVCEDCLTGSRIKGVIHRCYRGSLAGSAAVVAMQGRAERDRTWHKSVHRFIALTNFAKVKFVAGGLPADRIVVRPNVVTAPSVAHVPRTGALFVGRLSSEKGVSLLLRSWAHVDTPLTIVGDGPERERLKAMAPANVRFVGHQAPDVVRQYMLSSEYLVVPSIWYEGFPMTIVEAYAAGLPVVASRIGSLAEVVNDDVEGRLFEPGDSNELASIANGLAGRPDTLSRYSASARKAYEQLYTPERGLKTLEAIYDDALREAA